MLFAETWLDLESVTLSEVTEGERSILYSITYTWNLKSNDTNELI